jgi:hypothetical protein
MWFIAHYSVVEVIHTLSVKRGRFDYVRIDRYFAQSRDEAHNHLFFKSHKIESASLSWPSKTRQIE